MEAVGPGGQDTKLGPGPGPGPRRGEYKPFFLCELCGNLLSSLRDFKDHLREKGVYACVKDECAYFTGSMVDLETHYRVQHQTYIPILCKHCDIVFLSVQDILEHVATLKIPGVFRGPFVVK